MTFYKKQCPVVQFYNQMGCILQHENNYVIGFGFKFSYSLDSSSHIDMVCCKALKTFGFRNETL